MKVNKQKIYDTLDREGFSEIDEINYDKDITVYDLFYEFDEDEIDAAKDYANENCSEKDGEDLWYNEYFLPYLIDIASDNVRDIMDDICDDMEITGEFSIYDMDKENYYRSEIVIAFAPAETKIDMDKICEKLDI